MLKTKKLDNKYFAPVQVTLETQKAFLDPMLLRFIVWLSSRKETN